MTYISEPDADDAREHLMAVIGAHLRAGLAARPDAYMARHIALTGEIDMRCVITVSATRTSITYEAGRLLVPSRTEYYTAPWRKPECVEERLTDPRTTRYSIWTPVPRDTLVA